MSLSLGARLGPYEVVESLGVGGMGEVYRARDLRLGRDVALKVLRPELASDPDRLRRFEREARAVAALNHPNILTIFDVGTHEGAPYVVTELLEGEDFHEVASQRIPTVRQTFGWALQAARGLEAAHAKGIVHRDLKPENVFLTTDGRVKVLDFGLAKLVERDPPAPSRSTAPGRVVGTVAYMSPEQALGHAVDARSDVFSFGVVLFELLARKHPFRRDTAAATLTAIVEQTPVDLESLSRRISPAVGGIVRRCLEKHPTEALAYAAASLELADRPEVRQVAVEALWRGPTELRFPFDVPYPHDVDFSPDGRWLAARTSERRGALWPSDGGLPTLLEGSEEGMGLRFSPQGDFVAGHMEGQTLGLWSVPEGRLLRTFDPGEGWGDLFFKIAPDSRTLITCRRWGENGRGAQECQSWTIDGGGPVLLARIEMSFKSATILPDVDPTWSRLAWADGRKVRIAPLEGTRVDATAAVTLEHESVVTGVWFDEQGRRLATSSDLGRVIQIWSLERDPPELLRTLAAPARPQGEYEAGMSVRLKGVTQLAFTPDGRHLVSNSLDNSVRLWPLNGGGEERSRILLQSQGGLGEARSMAMAPDGSFVALGDNLGRVRVLPLDRGPALALAGFKDMVKTVAVGSEGRLVAGGAGQLEPQDALVRVWDLATGEVRVLDAGDGKEVFWVGFTGEGRVLALSQGMVLRVWNLVAKTPRVEEETVLDSSRPEHRGGSFRGWGAVTREVVLSREGRLWIQNLETHATRDLTWDSSDPSSLLLIAHDGLSVYSRDDEGTVRIGLVGGPGPHLFPGHPIPPAYLGAYSAVVSSDGRWLATGGSDGTIRLWPMPDLSKPPLHTLPRDELIAKLQSLTNLRAVPSAESPTGWTIEAGPFPGWEELPTW